MTPARSHSLLALFALFAAACGGSGTAGDDSPRAFCLPVSCLDKRDITPAAYALAEAGAMADSASELGSREPRWLFQATVVDQSASMAARGIRWRTPLERVYWEVTEGFLIARRANDRPEAAAREDILSVYRITSHFDTRDGVDPFASTGEGAIAEVNARPWQRRRYVQVDWSANLVSGYESAPLAGGRGHVRAESIAHYVSNPADPDHPVAERGADGVSRYLDVTNRALLHVEEAGLAAAGLPGVPACTLLGGGGGRCRPVDVVMRASFRRVDRERDYAPQRLDDARGDRFGVQSVEGRPEHGIYPTPRFAARRDLWQRSHARPEDRVVAPAPAGTLDHLESVAVAPEAERVCTAAVDCASLAPSARCDVAAGRCGDRFVRCTDDNACAPFGHGARCDLDVSYTRDDFAPLRGRGFGLCVLPYRQREVRPVAFHLAPGYPEHLVPAARAALREWNEAFSRAVRSARHRECLLDPATADRASCEAYRDVASGLAADARHVVVGCHGPVWGTAEGAGRHSAEDVAAANAEGWDLPRACGPQGTVARPGDLRFDVIESPQDFDGGGEWGMAGAAVDPATGEIHAAHVFVSAAATDMVSRSMVDVLRVLNGDAPLVPDPAGVPGLEAYGGILRDRVSPGPSPDERYVHADITSRGMLDAVLARTNFAHLVTSPRLYEPNAAGSDPAVHPDVGSRWLSLMARGADGHVSAGNFMANAALRVTPQTPLVGGTADVEARSAMQRTGIEPRLMNREELQAAGHSSVLGVTDAASEDASPLRRNTPSRRALADAYRGRLSAEQCNLDLAVSFEDSAAWLFQFRENAPPWGEDFGRGWNFRTPGENESGNPRLDYPAVAGYVTTALHRGVLAHELGHAFGAAHNFAASADATNYHDGYWDLRRRANPGGGYAPRFEHLARGEGYYSAEEDRGGIEAYASSSAMDYRASTGAARGLGRYDYAFVKHTYVDMVEAFDRVADRESALAMFQTTSGRGQQSVAFGVRADLGLTSFHYTDLARVAGARADGTPDVRDDNRFDVFVSETARVGHNPFRWEPDHTNVARANRDGTRDDAAGHVVVPYRFASDDRAGREWYDRGFDRGADAYESTRSLATGYLDYGFIHARAPLGPRTPEAYRTHVRRRFLDPIYYAARLTATQDALLLNVFAGAPGLAAWEASPSERANRLSVATAFDTFVNALTAPGPQTGYGGFFALRDRADSTRVFDNVRSGDRVDLALSPVDGRGFETTYEPSAPSGPGAAIAVGSYHDKVMALDYLTDTFFSPDAYAVGVPDVQRAQVNVYTVYPAQTLRLFGSILSRDHDDVAPQVRDPGPGYSLVRAPLATINLPPGTAPGQSGRDPALHAIDPALGVSIELRAALDAVMNLCRPRDRRFAQNVRVWSDGESPDPGPGSDVPVVSFRDPATGLTYRAIHMGAGPGEPSADVGLSRRDAAHNEAGVAARMLLHAQALADAVNREVPGSEARRALMRELDDYVFLIATMRDLSRSIPTPGP